MGYDLTKDVQEYFEFTIDEHKYRMRYPTTEEALESDKLKDDPIKAGEWVHRFVEPVSENAPPIMDLLNKSSVKVLQNFTQMVKTEFGG